MADFGHGEDVSRQREEVLSIGQSFLSQLVPGSPEYVQFQAELQRLAQNVGSPANEQGMARDIGLRLVQQQQARAAAGEAITPQQQQTNTAFQQFRDVSAFTPEELAVLEALRGELGDEGLTDLERTFQSITRTGADPSSVYESTLQPQLDLAFDQINRQAAQRGLVDSGIPLELSQRAAAELAIREAESRQAFRQQALGNVKDLFNVGQALRQREINLEGANVNLAQGREADILDLLRSQSASAFKREEALGERTTDRFATLGDAARLRDQEEGAARSKMLGQGLGAAAGFFLGGPAGAKAGANLGGSLFGGGGDAGSSVESLLASRRQDPVSGAFNFGNTQPQPTSRLSKSSSILGNDDKFNELLAAFQG